MKHLNKTYAWIIGGVLFVMALVATMVYFIPMNTPIRTYQANQLLEKIYQDGDRVMVSDQTSVHDIQKGYRLANRLKGSQKEHFLQEIVEAENKFRNIAKLKQIVDVKVEDIIKEGTKIHFNQDVTPETFQENLPLTDWKYTDSFTQKVDSFVQQIDVEWENFQEKVQKMASLKPKFNNDPNKMLVELRDLVEFDRFVQDNKDHSAVKTHFDHYQKTSKKLFQEVVDIYNSDKLYSVNMYNAVMEHPSFSKWVKEDKLDLRPKVSITFDDGPDPDFTPQILDILDNHEIKATFFMMGMRVVAAPDLAKEVLDRGHQIGNHTYSHTNLAGISDDLVKYEIVLAQDTIENATGFRPELYRMPYGDGGERVVKVLDKMTSIMWNADTNDWALSTPEEVYDFVEPMLNYDDIVVLMHDVHPQTVGALDDILTTLKERNFKFVGPTELEYYERYRDYAFE